MKRILIVEDDAALRATLAEQIAIEGDFTLGEAGVDGGPDARFSGASHSSLCVGWRMDGGVLLGVMPSCRVVSG